MFLMSCHHDPSTTDCRLHLSVHSVLCVCAEEWSEAVKPSSSVHSQSTSNTNWSFSSPQLPAIFDSAPIIFDNLQTSELCNSQKIVCKIWMVDVVYFYRKTIIIITGVIFYEYYVFYCSGRRKESPDGQMKQVKHTFPDYQQ